MPRRPLADITSLATYLGTSKRHVRHLVARKAIPYTKAGGLLRFDLDKIDTWLEQNSHEAAS